MVSGGNKRSRGSASAAQAEVDADAAGPGPSSSQAQSQQGLCVLHRSRMFDWKPSAVVCIAACPAGPLFAVAYENGCLELWDMNHLVCIQVRNVATTAQCTAFRDHVVSAAWRLVATAVELLWKPAVINVKLRQYENEVYHLLYWSSNATSYCLVCNLCY